MKVRLFLNAMKAVLGIMMCIICFAICQVDVKALTLEYDENNQEIIISGVPETDSEYNYSVNGYIKYGDERIESFCYGTASIWYDVPSAQAYIFSYSDKEFLFPCSGTYTMTAWIEKRSLQNWDAVEKTDTAYMEFYFQKKDESTNWGPGLPETMIESWEVGEIQGKNKEMVVSGGDEEHSYTWTINGNDVYSVPADEEIVNLEILSMDARFDGDIPGNEITSIKLDIAHSGSFGFTARLDYALGSEHAGRYANLFYILEPGKYEFVQSCQIDANGVATFYLDHASSYFLVVRDEAYEGDAIVGLAPVPETELQTEEETEQSTQGDSVEDSSNENEETISSVEPADKVEGNTGLNENEFKTNGSFVGIIAVTIVIGGMIVVYLLKRNKRE